MGFRILVTQIKKGGSIRKEAMAQGVTKTTK
jgi:hypothetical protein